jgi:hypothetical protein
MAQKQVWVTPTLTATIRIWQEMGEHDFESDDRKRFLFPAIWESWDPKLGRRKTPSSDVRKILTEVNKRAQKATVAAYKAASQCWLEPTAESTTTM